MPSTDSFFSTFNKVLTRLFFRGYGNCCGPQESLPGPKNVGGYGPVSLETQKILRQKYNLNDYIIVYPVGSKYYEKSNKSMYDVLDDITDTLDKSYKNMKIVRFDNLHDDEGVPVYELTMESLV